MGDFAPVRVGLNKLLPGCPIPPDGRQNGSGRSVTPAWFGIPPPLGSVVAPDHLLLLLGVAPGVGLHRSTVVEDADDVSVHPHGDEPTGSWSPSAISVSEARGSSGLARPRRLRSSGISSTPWRGPTASSTRRPPSGRTDRTSNR